MDRMRDGEDMDSNLIILTNYRTLRLVAKPLGSRVNHSSMGRSRCSLRFGWERPKRYWENQIYLRNIRATLKTKHDKQYRVEEQQTDISYERAHKEWKIENVKPELLEVRDFNPNPPLKLDVSPGPSKSSHRMKKEEEVRENRDSMLTSTAEKRAKHNHEQYQDEDKQAIEQEWRGEHTRSVI